MQNEDTLEIRKITALQIANEDPLDFMIRDLFSEKLGIDVESIKSDSTIADDLNIDSLDFIEIIGEIEKRFRVKIEDEDSEKFRTIGQITLFIKHKI